jgi:hypothetical protein
MMNLRVTIEPLVVDQAQAIGTKERDQAHIKGQARGAQVN